MLKDVGILAACALFAMALIMAIKFVVGSFNCWADWSSSNLEWRMRALSCQVKHPTYGWMPADKVRGTE